MDVGTATSQTLAAYQSTTQTSGKSAAVLQALTQAYSASSSAASASGSDPLAALAGASAISALTIGINSVSQAMKAGGGTSPISGSPFAATFSGLDTSSATSLLAGLAGTSDSSGLQGFGSGLTGGASLAIAAYQAQQDYGSGTLGSDAGSKAAETTAAGSTQGTTTTTASADPVTAAYLQAIAQANQGMANLSLLA